MKTLFFIKIICKTLKIKFEIPDLTFRWLPPKQPNFHLPHLTLFPFTWRNGSKLVQSKRLFWNPETWKSFLKKKLENNFCNCSCEFKLCRTKPVHFTTFFCTFQFYSFSGFSHEIKVVYNKAVQNHRISLIFSAF